MQTTRAPLPQAPASLDGTGLARWGEASYGSVTGSGAGKLASSAVAPLVCAARGYRTLTMPDVKPLATSLGVHPQSAPARQLARAVGDRDALLMPTFKPDVTVAYWRQQTPSYVEPASSLQYRPHPANVVVSPDGKARKYENLSGQPTVLGVHPGTAPSFVTEPVPVIIVVEGLLKADSCLSAYLAAYASDPSILDFAGDIHEARRLLRETLEAIPEDERVLIVSTLSVTTWRQNPEWSSLRVRDADVWVAFDGDVASKPGVWKQANDAFEYIRSRGGRAGLISLPDEVKTGVDDYLAAGHDWADLSGLVTPKLPARPRVDVDSTVRMNASTLTFQVLEPGDPARDIPSRWVDKAGAVARVVEVLQRRGVTTTETQTGVLDPNVSGREGETRCVVEVSWPDEKALVEGPATMLAVPPDRWTDSRVGAYIPPNLLRHPDWPPRSPDYLKAMKEWRREETVSRHAWSHMGWVPGLSSPVFVVGNQVIGPDGDVPDGTLCAVDDSEVQGASKFGVDVSATDDAVKIALRRLLKVYGSCWSDRRNAAVVLSAALRPCVPIETRVPVLLAGTTSAGKSFTAESMMAFWQAFPGSWEKLPGSAADTGAATEVAVSCMPIWVYDDIAPNAADPVSQARTAGQLSNLLRAIHNGAFKARRKHDMTAAAVYKPRALLVATAEAAPSDMSIMNRVVHVPVAPGFLVPEREPTDAMLAMMHTGGEPAVVSGHVLKVLARDIASRGWPAAVDDWRTEKDLQRRAILDLLTDRIGPQRRQGVDPSRQAATVADLSLGLLALSAAVDDLGMAGDKVEFAGKQVSVGTLMGQLLSDLFDVAIASFVEGASYDTGEVLLARVRALLASGTAHISGGGIAGPPVTVGMPGIDDAAAANVANSRLGWTFTGDEYRPATPGGTRIGSLVVYQDRPIVMIDPASAWALVQRTYGKDGHSQGSAWSMVWAAGLPDDSFKRRQRAGARMPEVSVRTMVAGTSYSGVPIRLDTLIDHT